MIPPGGTVDVGGFPPTPSSITCDIAALAALFVRVSLEMGAASLDISCQVSMASSDPSTDLDQEEEASKAPKQIGLRLYPKQLEALDAYCSERGLDRTSAVRMAITRLLEGPAPSGSPAAHAALSGGYSVDQEARDAITRLAAKVNLIAASELKSKDKIKARLAALEAEKAQADAPTGIPPKQFDAFYKALEDAKAKEPVAPEFNPAI